MSRSIQAFLAMWAFLSVGLTCALAFSHPTAHSTMLVNIDTDKQHVDVLTSVNAVDLGEFLRLDSNGNNVVEPPELEASKAQIEAYLVPRVNVENDDKRCEANGIRFVPSGAPSKELNLVFRWTCDTPLSYVKIANSILFDDVGGHRHQSKIQVGKKIDAVILSRQNPVYETYVGPSDKAPPALTTEANLRSNLSFVWEGVIHILGGLDHVLFVFCLLVVARDPKRLALVITAFTLGHSVTLGLAALDVLSVPAKVIEPLIALTIAVVCLENIIRPDKDPQYRFVLTAFFGLIHGFGFSYVLRDNVGLPADAALVPLLLFNVGVEVGQLALIALTFPLLRKFRDHARYKWFVLGTSGLMLALATYWGVERLGWF